MTTTSRSDIPDQALIEELRALADARGQIARDPTVRGLLELARERGLARPHPSGAIRFVEFPEPRQKTVEIFGCQLPLAGVMYDVWILDGEAKQ